jgi:amino acid transporter
MSNDPSSSDPHQPQPRLEYQSPLPPASTTGQSVTGFVLAALILAVSVFVGIMGSMGYRRAGQSAPVVLIVITAAATLLINLWAFLTYRNPARRPFAQGLWIGFAVTALIEGLCFVGARL